MKLISATSTHVGRVRDSNQDRAMSSDRVAAVADGMGGHAGGEQAALMAVAEFNGARGDLSPPRLVEIVEAANQRIFEAADDPKLRGMGTTIVAALFDPSVSVVSLVNVGDSRGYLFRDGILRQITVDHSLVDELVRQGRITPAEAETHPQRNVVTRALGIGPQVEVDTFSVDVVAGDRILLASDGLFNEVSSEELGELLAVAGDPKQTADDLVEAALKGGGRDNVTVAVLDLVDEDDDAQASAVLDAKGSHSDNVLAEVARPRKRRFPLRSILIFCGLLLMIGIGVGGPIYTSRNSYYVDADEGFVAIYRGRPGGFLWTRPSLERTTDVRVEELDGASRERLSQRPVWSTEAEAQGFADNLSVSDVGG